MKCAQVRNLFSMLVDGELDPRRRLLLEEHLASCESCAEKFAAYQAADRSLRADIAALAQPAGLQADLWPSVRTRLAQTPESRLAALTSRSSKAFASLARRPAAALGAAALAATAMFLALSAIFAAAMRPPDVAMSRTQTRQLVAFTIRVTRDGRIVSDAKSREYVLLLDARDRWLR